MIRNVAIAAIALLSAPPGISPSEVESPRRGPELIREFFRDWHEPFPADLDLATRQRIRAEIEALPAEPALARGGAALPWQPFGPFGMDTPDGGRHTGRIVDLAIDASGMRAAAAASGGVWEREPAGWQSRTDALPTQWIGSIAVHPSNPDVMLAGTGEPFIRAGAGLWKTTNGGQTWTRKAMTPEPATCFRVRYAPDGITVHGAFDLGYYRSTNGGETWSNRLALSAWPTDLELHPVDPGILFLTVYGRGLFRSTNAGFTWAKMPAAGLPDTTTGRGAVTVCAADPSRMYVAWAQPGGAMLGVFRSTDAGATWADVSPEEYMWGQGWYNNTIAVCPTDPDLVLAGGGGLYRTTDGGATWIAATDPHLHADYHASEWAANGTDVWVAHDGGWSRSTDAGASWDVGDNTLPITQYVLVDADPFRTPFVLGRGSQDNGISITTDGGASWRFRAGGDGGGFAVDPTDPARMYATWGIFSGVHPFIPHRSTNGGVTWTRTSGGIGACSQWWTRIRADGASPPKVFTYGDRWVYWLGEPLAFWWGLNGNPNPFPHFVSELTVSRREPGAEWPVVWACLDSSIDGERLEVWDGTAFLERSAGLPSGVRVRKVAVHPNRSDRAWALMNGMGTPGQKLFRTTDRGLSWANVTGNLPDVPLGDLVAHPADDALWWVGSEMGCFATTDAGATWSRWQLGMPEATAVTEMRWIDAGGAFHVVAGTYGRGMWVRDTGFAGATAAPEARAVATAPDPGLLELHAAAPNPFAESTALAFTLPREGHVTLRILDVAGREVARPADGVRVAGFHRVRVAAESLAPGVYFVRLEADGRVATGRITRIR